MAYGILMRNNQNSRILGEGVVPVVISDQTEIVSASSGKYNVVEKSGFIPCFKLTASMNKIVGTTKADNYSDYEFCIPDTFEFNGSSNIGNVTFNYLAYGDSVSYPSGGWGIVTRDENQNITFHSNSLLFQPTSVHRLNKNQSVTISNGTVILPIAWMYSQPFNGNAYYGILERQGTSNTFTAVEQNSSSYNGMMMAIALFEQ